MHINLGFNCLLSYITHELQLPLLTNALDDLGIYVLPLLAELLTSNADGWFEGEVTLSPSRIQTWAVRCEKYKIRTIHDAPITMPKNKVKQFVANKRHNLFKQFTQAVKDAPYINFIRLNELDTKIEDTILLDTALSKIRNKPYKLTVVQDGSRFDVSPLRNHPTIDFTYMPTPKWDRSIRLWNKQSTATFKKALLSHLTKNPMLL